MKWIRNLWNKNSRRIESQNNILKLLDGILIIMSLGSKFPVEHGSLSTHSVTFLNIFYYSKTFVFKIQQFSNIFNGFVAIRKIIISN